MQRLPFLLLLVSALVQMPGISSAQSCDYTRVYQELSLKDTLNSQGTSLGEAFAVFQQDRFYVNQKNRLDRGDKPDEIMVNRNSRAKYGQAIRNYMNTHGMADIQINDVIGNQYIVELEVCGAQDNPSFRVTSLSVRSEQQDNGNKIDFEPLLKKLTDLENSLNQRNDEWQKQEKRFRNTIEKLQNLLTEREREISNLQFEIKKLRDAAMLDGSSKQSLSIQKMKTTWPESLNNYSKGSIRTILANTKWSITPQERCYLDAESYLQLDDEGYSVVINGDVSAAPIPSIEFKTRLQDTRLNEGEFYAVYQNFNPGRKWPSYPDLELKISGRLLGDGKLQLNTTKKVKDILSNKLQYLTKQISEIRSPCIEEPKPQSFIENVDAVNILQVPSDVSKNSLSLSDCEGSLKTISRNSKDWFVSTYRKKSENKLIFEMIPGEKGCTKGLRDIGVCKKLSEIWDYSISNGLIYMSSTDDENCTINTTVPNVFGIQQGNVKATSQCTGGASERNVSFLVCTPLVR